MSPITDRPRIVHTKLSVLEMIRSTIFHLPRKPTPRALKLNRHVSHGELHTTERKTNPRTGCSKNKEHPNSRRTTRGTQTRSIHHSTRHLRHLEKLHAALFQTFLSARTSSQASSGRSTEGFHRPMGERRSLAFSSTGSYRHMAGSELPPNITAEPG